MVVQGVVGLERQGIRLDLSAVTQVVGLCIQIFPSDLTTVAQLLGIELHTALSGDGSGIVECVGVDSQVLSGTNGTAVGQAIADIGGDRT